MPLLKRLSDTFWSYVSPQKTNDGSTTTPRTEPQFKKPTRPAKRTTSLHQISKHARSMSPVERVDNWRVGSESSQATPLSLNRKRKRTSSPSAGAVGSSKRSRQYDERDQGEDATAGGEEESDREPSHGVGSFTSDDDLGDLDSLPADATLVVSPSTYARSSPSSDYSTAQARVISIPEELSIRNISTEELRSQGRDDDYITLIQKIAMRGHEPLLPNYFKFDYRFLPDGLFESNEDAFIGSVYGRHFRAIKALERLFELGGRVRDRVEMAALIQPEEEVRRQVAAYTNWAQRDADIEMRTAIPLLAVECQPANTPAKELQSNATEKCRHLAARYRERLRVSRSVEMSPTGSNDTQLSYPLPTFYAIVASYTLVAIMAYQPDREMTDHDDNDAAAQAVDEEPACTPMAYLDFRNKDYDVWNALALAIVTCHVRNVQMRLADETGIGMRVPENENPPEDEEDLDS